VTSSSFYNPPHSPIGALHGGPRRFITDPFVIDCRMKQDMVEVFAARRVVYVTDMIQCGWTLQQIERFLARQISGGLA
jgi:hypothetical protein